MTDDVKREAFGAVSLGITGEELVPDVQDLIPLDGLAAMGFCTRCGRLTFCDLEYANIFAEKAGLPEQTEKSLIGKYFQMSACMRCSVSPKSDRIELLDIPRTA